MAATESDTPYHASYYLYSSRTIADHVYRHCITWWVSGIQHHNRLAAFRSERNKDSPPKKAAAAAAAAASKAANLIHNSVRSVASCARVRRGRTFTLVDHAKKVSREMQSASRLSSTKKVKHPLESGTIPLECRYGSRTKRISKLQTGNRGLWKPL